MRLIDAEDIKDYWVESECSKEEFIKENLPDDADYSEYSDFFDKVLQAFKNVVDTSTTIDAEPIVHGHWIWNEDLHRYECSVCHGECATSFTENPLFKPFCGECGAKMDEETETKMHIFSTK